MWGDNPFECAERSEREVVEHDVRQTTATFDPLKWVLSVFS